MKNRYILNAMNGVALLIGVAVVSASCNKFLDTPSDNRTEIDTEDKVLQLLTSAYPSHSHIMFSEAMSDDVDDIGIEYDMSHYDAIQLESFNWGDVSSEQIDTPSAYWESAYKGIAAANQALVSIQEMGGPNKSDKLAAAYGEALLVRAFQYFKLVQLFCMPYDTQYADSDFGVPYLDKPETTVNPKYGRNTVAFIYDKIDQDIREGLPYVKDTYYLVPKYHFTRQSANGFAAEFYLFYKKYELAIQHANEVIGGDAVAALRDVSKYPGLPLDSVTQGNQYRSASDEANLLMSAPYTWTGRLSANNGYYKRFCTNEFISQNESILSSSIIWDSANNGAANSFIWPAYGWRANITFATKFTSPFLFQYSDQAAGIGWPRGLYTEVGTDNTVLVRAEAYVLTGQYDAAMSDINAWRTKRLLPKYADKVVTVDGIVGYYGIYGGTTGLISYTPLAPSPKKKLQQDDPATILDPTKESMIHAILHIRRMEFWGEGRRWQDIRRYNIEIYRRQYRTTGIQGTIASMDKLKYRDPRMAIQIPMTAISAGLDQNPR